MACESACGIRLRHRRPSLSIVEANLEVFQGGNTTGVAVLSRAEEDHFVVLAGDCGRSTQAYWAAPNYHDVKILRYSFDLIKFLEKDVCRLVMVAFL